MQFIHAMPKRRGRPPKDPHKIAERAAQAASYNASASVHRVIPPTTGIPGTYNYDSLAYSAANMPRTLNAAMGGNTPIPLASPQRDRDDSNPLELNEGMHQGAQSSADAAMVAMLDTRLQKWNGPELQLPGNVETGGIRGSGWWGEGSDYYERDWQSWPQRMKGVLEALQGYRDASCVIRVKDILMSLLTHITEVCALQRYST